MDIDLSPVEARVLGVLIEKGATTPDYYPLSLSAVVSACNQKSNRDPVMSLDETQAIDALDGLIGKRLAWEKTPSGSRVTKYAHRLSNTLGLTYDFPRHSRRCSVGLDHLDFAAQQMRIARLFATGLTR